MNYSQTISYLFDKLPMYQRQGSSAYKKDLTNIKLLCDKLNNPQNKYRNIHIAGTNGKGSVSHILASVLQTAGYKTGLYTSPHLKDFRERIKVNGQNVSENFVVDFVEKNRNVIEKINPSFFEITVAMAFEYFAEENVDFAVIETGLGGRLDSTNIITPILSVITNISYDHMSVLGNSFEEIATEKAGIIKRNVPVVIGEVINETRSVFIEKAESMNAPVYLASYTFSSEFSSFSDDNLQIFNINKGGEIFYSGLKCDLTGIYQKKNIITALQAVEILKGAYDISENHIYRAFANVKQNTGLRGRWDILGKNPLTICDTGHNEAGISEVLKHFKLLNFNKLHFVIGTVNDKEIDKILSLLPKDAVYYFTKADIPRALSENILKDKASDFKLYGNSYPTVIEAFEAAKNSALSDDLVFVGGSTFVVAEIL